jgi:hypothetical protein
MTFIKSILPLKFSYQNSLIIDLDILSKLNATPALLLTEYICIKMLEIIIYGISLRLADYC